ncbi:MULTISPECIES: hypothetical protein [Natrialbaceae]|uniref:hypothetical protein n=1 Tax=Natrialbaceae TaxID=1644061 RepID=UPI00207C7981|nr:hypothetical protein [Natronococcus sp. CG52]
MSTTSSRQSSNRTAREETVREAPIARRRTVPTEPPRTAAAENDRETVVRE